MIIGDLEHINPTSYESRQNQQTNIMPITISLPSANRRHQLKQSKFNNTKLKDLPHNTEDGYMKQLQDKMDENRHKSKVYAGDHVIDKIRKKWEIQK